MKVLFAVLVLASFPFAIQDATDETIEDVVQTEADSEVKERLAEYAEAAGRELPFAWTEHFLVMCDHGGFKFGKKKLSEGELAAEVARFAEAVFVDYCEVFDLVPRKAFGNRAELLLWKEQEDHLKVSRDFLEWTAGEETEDWPIYRRGDRATYGFVLGSNWAKDDDAVRKRLVHNIARGLLSAQKPSGMISSTGNGWLSVGLGMWFEDRAYGTVGSVDQRNVMDELPGKKGKWRGIVKKLVKKKKIEDFEALVQSGEQQLDGDGSMVAASLIDFLASKDLVLFREFVLHMKSRSPTRDSVQVTYGWKIEEFEEAWNEWVLKSY